MEKFDAVIIGAGPAGLLTAIKLREKGWRVCVLDKAIFPRAKVCGGFLGPENRALLDELDVYNEIISAGMFPVKGVTLAGRSGSFAGWSLSEHKGYGPALGVDRGCLDYILYQKALRAGVELKTGVQIAHVRTGITNVVGYGKGAEVCDVSSKVLINASGAGHFGRHRKEACVGAFRVYKDLPQAPDKVGMYFSKNGHAGITPIGKGLWNVGFVIASARYEKAGKNFDQIFAELVAGNARLSAMLTGAQPQGTWQGAGFAGPYLEPMQDGVFNVGTAAGGINPVVGGGMGIAFRNALLLASVLGKYPPGSLAAVSEYSWKYRWHFGLPIYFSWVLGALAHAAVADVVVRLLGMFPAVQRFVFNIHHHACPD